MKRLSFICSCLLSAAKSAAKPAARRAAALAAALAAAAALATPASALEIGVIMPLSGPVAAYGQSCLAGIKLANKMHPQLANGEPITLKIIDNKGDKIESLSAAERAMTSASAIIGAMLTGNTTVIMNAAEKRRVPVIAPAATSDKLLRGKHFAARVCFNDSFQGVKMAQHLAGEGLKRVVIVKDQSTDYSLGLAKAFKKELARLGGTIVREFAINGGDKDYSAIASALAATDADAVYAPIYYAEASMFAAQARAAGVALPFAGTDGVADEQFIRLAKDAAEGYVYTDSFDASVPPTALSREFIAAHEREYGSAEVANFTAMGADAYFVLAQAAERCAAGAGGASGGAAGGAVSGGAVSAECINAQVRQTSGFAGVSGEISIDATGETKRSLIIKKIENGKARFLKQM